MTATINNQGINETDDSYSDYYHNFDIKVYPSEFVIRAFLGSYPGHHINRSDLSGKKILDLGFGDGRNMPLFFNLGMEVHGVEVTQSICELVKKRMKHEGIMVETRVGRNQDIPYDDNHFDYVLASSSCYYMDQGCKYQDSVDEIYRILKPGGMFIHSLPMPSTFIMENAIDTGDGHMRITQDPYGVRVGAILKSFDDVNDIENHLKQKFTDIQIGSVKDDYWGRKVHLWLVACIKK